MNLLKELTATHKKTQDCLRKYQWFHASWSTWNHWAQQQPEYAEWMAENCLEFKDVKAASDRGMDIVFSMDEGNALFKGRSLAYHEWEMARQELSDLLRQIWKDRTPYGEWRYSLKEIALAWGKSPGYVIGTLSRQPWYQSRTEISGVHPSKGWNKRA